MISQSCDLINGTNLMDKKMANNCSTNSSAIMSIQCSSNSGYLIEKQSPSIQSACSRQFQSSSSSQVPISPISFNASFKSDAEFLSHLTADELIYRLKTLEGKNRKLTIENGSLIRDLNSNLANIQLIRHQMIELKKDNSELRDLVCYLDSERTRAREVACEWESFGDHMSKVLKKEISNYNKKLQQLESKQFELVKENYELKQLCLLLDKAMLNKTTLDKQQAPVGETNNPSINGQANDKQNENNESNDATGETSKRKSLFNHKVLNYIKLLENKLEQYQLDNRLSARSSDVHASQNELFEQIKFNRPDELNKAMEILCLEQSLDLRKDECTNGALANGFTSDKSKVRFEDSSLNGSIISEDQKSIIKQLCSAAYKKIEDE